MNRIQVANHEKSESIRLELRNFARKFDAIGAAISTIETSISDLKLNFGESSGSILGYFRLFKVLSSP